MPTIDSIFTSNDHIASSSNIVSRGRDGNLPQERASYTRKRRQMDLDLIYEVWNTLPQDAIDSKINILKVPNNIRKKYHRAVKVHKDVFQHKDDTFVTSGARSFPKFQNMLPHSLEMLEEFQQKLPSYQSKIISDMPLDFRSTDKAWLEAEAKGLTVLRYWQYYRVSNAYKNKDKPVSSYRYANEGLSLLPPLSKGEMPHKHEVLTRLHRYFALIEMSEDEQALVECRAILAAIRLLHHEGRLNMYDSNDILMGKTDVLPHQFISLSIRVKMNEKGASRPYFTKDERLALMKELGVGLYSDARYKCSTCGIKPKSNTKDGGVKKLSLCSRCSDVWYCGAECAKKGWTMGGHKQSCGSLPVEMPIKVTLRTFITIKKETMVPSGVSIVDNKNCGYLLVLAKDESDEEYFDVLTNLSVQVEPDEKGATAEGECDQTMRRQLRASMNGLSCLSIDDSDTGMTAKELHDTREAFGFSDTFGKVPYNKKWPDDF